MSLFGSNARAFSGKGRADRAERRETSQAGDLSQIGQYLRTVGDYQYQMASRLQNPTLLTLEAVLRGERPANMRVFAPERETVESQFNNARNNIIATTPTRGGQLNRALVDANFQRARALGSLEADVRKQAFQQALGLGWQQGPLNSLTAFTGAQNAFSRAAGVYSGQAERADEGTAQTKNTLLTLGGMAARGGMG